MPGCVHHAPPAPKPAPPRHVRLVDAAGRPLEVRPDQVADLVTSGLATEVLPERYTERPMSRAELAAGGGDTKVRRFEPAVYQVDGIRSPGGGPRPTPRPRRS